MTYIYIFGALVIVFIGGYLRGRNAEQAANKPVVGALQAKLLHAQMERHRAEKDKERFADDNIALRAERDALAKQVKMPIKKVEVD